MSAVSGRVFDIFNTLSETVGKSIVFTITFVSVAATMGSYMVNKSKQVIRKKLNFRYWQNKGYFNRFIERSNTGDHTGRGVPAENISELNGPIINVVGVTSQTWTHGHAQSAVTHFTETFDLSSVEGVLYGGDAAPASIDEENVFTFASKLSAELKRPLYAAQNMGYVESVPESVVNVYQFTPERVNWTNPETGDTTTKKVYSGYNERGELSGVAALLHGIENVVQVFFSFGERTGPEELRAALACNMTTVVYLKPGQVLPVKEWEKLHVFVVRPDGTVTPYE